MYLLIGGDETNTKVNNPVSSLTQYYHDEKSEHLIEFIGEISKIGFGCFASNEGVLEVEISENITDIGNKCFVHCINLTKCNLYWIGDNIVDYTKLYSNDDTIYVIPKGETDNYIMKGYPSNNLIERGG